MSFDVGHEVFHGLGIEALAVGERKRDQFRIERAVGCRRRGRCGHVVPFDEGMGCYASAWTARV